MINESRSGGKVHAAIAALVIIIPVWCGASEGQQSNDDGPQEGSYPIAKGDTLDIVVWKTPDLSREVTVRPDGWISLPLVNDIRAVGKTPMELKRTITARLTEFVSEPVVSVIVTQIRDLEVTLLGKVTGKVLFQDPKTILEVLAMSGGFDEFSKPKDIYVVRGKGNNPERLKVNYSEMIKGEEVNIRVEDGDLIIVE